MKKEFTALMAASLLCIFTSQCPAAFSSKEKSSVAKITEAHGDVFKRGFVDWEREVWGEPCKAGKGDLLQEGMQVGTGEKSWAQLSWSYITARAWANSVYAIAPNQRLVYLMSGEMLYHLDKNRKDKSDYFVWTKLIQARLRGTTVLFQSTKDSTRITVLEGCVDVLNRKDKSVVRIEPGVVYEVKELHPDAALSSSSTANPAAVGSSANTATSLTPITVNNIPPINLFETKSQVTSLYVANPSGLLNHPLLSSLESPLESLPLVGSTLGALIPTVSNLLDSTTGLLKDGIAPLLGQTLLSESKIIAVPTALSYNVGPLVGTAFNLPQAVSFFPPKGIIGQAITGPGAVLPNLTQTGAIGKMSDLGNLTGGLAGTVNGRSGLVPNMVPNINVIPSTTSAITNLSGFGATSGLTGGATNIVGGAGGTVGGVVGGLGGVVGGVGGVVGGGQTGGGGLIPGVVGGATGLIQGTTGGLGSILGGGGGGGGLLGLPLGGH